MTVGRVPVFSFWTPKIQDMPQTQTQTHEELPFFWWSVPCPLCALSLSPPALISFDRYQNTDKPVPLTLPTCSQVDFAIGPNNASDLTPSPPYTLIVYPAGFAPKRIDAGNGKHISYTVDLPEGTTALFQFVDSQGISGGVSPLTTIVSLASVSDLL